MNKIKSLEFFLLIFGVVVVSGCFGQPQPTPDKPYITSVSFDKSFGVEGDTINIAITVANPTTVNYDGYVLVQADSSSCFGMYNVNVGLQQPTLGYSNTISVLAGASNSALIIMHIPQNAYNDITKGNCYQPSSHKLGIFILQNGLTMDSKQYDFSIFQKK